MLIKCCLLVLEALAVGIINPARAVEAGVSRQDFQVTTKDGIRLFVRELRPSAIDEGKEPLILIHGARVPGIASFDLAVPGGSLAADLAVRIDRLVYVMDARGYGGSQRPAALDEPADANRPQVHAYEVVRDIAAVAAAAEQRSGSHSVALLGWATGGMWAAYYASLYPERVGHLVTLNALYGGSDRHPQLGPGSPVSDPAHPDRLSPKIGAYYPLSLIRESEMMQKAEIRESVSILSLTARISDSGYYARNDAASLLPSWDRSIPVSDKAVWRDPALIVAYQMAALASDPLSNTQTPPAFRAPMGAIEDSFYQASGRRLFDASSITSPVLIIRSERDFWSRPGDAQSFAHDAVHAALVRVLVLPDATHYVHLDRPERGRDQLIREVTSFLTSPQSEGK
jgi:pimeloyl-ACP methyl ester carboxylesterase